MNENTIIDRIKELLGEKVVEITLQRSRRIFLIVSPENLLETIRILKNDLGFYHISTISGVDRTKDFEILYHLANNQTSLTVRVSVSRENPEIQSVCEVIPGAILYERELQDMLGIKVINIPDPRPLVLPDDWQQGNYPLRKDWSYKSPEEKIPGEKQ